MDCDASNMYVQLWNARNDSRENRSRNNSNGATAGNVIQAPARLLVGFSIAAIVSQHCYCRSNDERTLIGTPSVPVIESHITRMTDCRYIMMLMMEGDASPR